MKDKEFLTWIHNRLVNVHHENQNYDYMHKLRSIIKRIPIEEDTRWEFNQDTKAYNENTVDNANKCNKTMLSLEQVKRLRPNLLIINSLEQLQQYNQCRNGYIVLPPAIIETDLTDRKYIIGNNSIICKKINIGQENIIEDNCFIDKYVNIDNYCNIGNFVTISKYCNIGDNCNIGNNCNIGHHSTIGNNCTIGYNVVIMHSCSFGKYITIYDKTYNIVFRVHILKELGSSIYFFMKENLISVIHDNRYYDTVTNFLHYIEENYKNNEFYLHQFKRPYELAKNKHYFSFRYVYNYEKQ